MNTKPNNTNNEFFDKLNILINEKFKKKAKEIKKNYEYQKNAFYKEFKALFGKEVRYDKIKRYGEQNLPKEYQYMIGLSKPPEKIKMSELSVSIPDIIKNLPEDFKLVPRKIFNASINQNFVRVF